MKLRLENNHICFRISREELDTLIEYGVIYNSTMGLTYSITLYKNAKSTSINYDNNNFTLTLSQQEVIEHRKNLPSKEGVVEEVKLNDGNIIRVSLEVDVRSRRNKEAKK